MTSRRIAIGLGGALIALAGLVGWAAARLEDQPASQSIDPNHGAVVTAAVLAAGFCIYALWSLRGVSRGRRGWLGASVWFGLALIALLVVVLVAFASRLGG